MPGLGSRAGRGHPGLNPNSKHNGRHVFQDVREFTCAVPAASLAAPLASSVFLEALSPALPALSCRQEQTMMPTFGGPWRTVRTCQRLDVLASSPQMQRPLRRLVQAQSRHTSRTQQQVTGSATTNS